MVVWQQKDRNIIMTDETEFTPISLDQDGDRDWGRLATRVLFKQHSAEGTEDINKWREVFVNTLDPTEYQGGIALVGSWSSWLKFKRNWPSFQRLYLDDWLEEIEIRLKSIAIKSLTADALTNGGAAAKFIAEGKYKERKAGRPSKESVIKQTRIDAELEKRIANDRERLGL